MEDIRKLISFALRRNNWYEGKKIADVVRAEIIIAFSALANAI